MTRDRRFKQRVRRRARETGENYTAALAAERETRPPPRSPRRPSETKTKEKTMTAKPAVATRLRGVWFGVEDLERSRAFYERLGAYFDDEPGAEGVVHATLGGMRLNFETASYDPHPSAGYVLLFDVTDADALHAELKAADCNVTTDPVNEPWGRRFNVHDPDGHEIAFIGPIR